MHTPHTTITTAQAFRAVILSLVIALGATYAYAWVGPTDTAPGNNIDGVLDVSNTDQAKGGVPPTTNIRLDVDNVSNAPGAPETLSSTNAVVWRHMYVGVDTPVPKGDAYVMSLNGPKALCADPSGTVVVCP